MRTATLALALCAATVLVSGPARAQKKEQEPVKVMLQDFKLKGETKKVDAGDVSVLGSSVCTGVMEGNTQRISCMGPEDVAAIAQIKAQSVSLGGCEGDLDACVDAFRQLGDPDYVIYGTITEVGGKLRLEAKLASVARSTLVASNVQTVGKAEDLIGAAQTAGKALAEHLLKAEAK